MAWDLAVSFGMGFATFVFAFLAVNFRSQHYPLQLLFLGMTVIMATATAWVLVLLAEINVQASIQAITSSIYTVMVVLVIFIFAYIIITFLIARLRELGHIGSKENE